MRQPTLVNFVCTFKTVQESHIKLVHKMAEKATLIPEVMEVSLDTSMVEEGRKSSPGQPSCLRMRW